MKHWPRFAIVAIAGVILLSGCSNDVESNSTETIPEITPKNNEKLEESDRENRERGHNNRERGNEKSEESHEEQHEHGHNGHDHENAQSQIIETDDYHLALVTAPQADGIHLHLSIENNNHEVIDNAKVKAIFQFPNNNEEKNLDFAYDSEEKLYSAFLPETAKGEYKLVVITEIGGEKINGRFRFKI